MYADLNRPPLHATELRRALVRADSAWTDIRVVESTGSTNADLVEAARHGAADGTVLIAESQDGGRGRQGRQWVSPPRAGLTFSVLLRPGPVSIPRWSWIPLLAGVALTRAVRRLGRVEARLKWPNDLLVGAERHKAAGVLAERSGDAVVLGIGLNVTTARGELPREDATSLALAGADCLDRTSLLRAILRELAEDVETWRAAAGDAERCGLRSAYKESCDTLGRPVRVVLPADATLDGEAVDIDQDGRLVVRGADGTTTNVAAGDVIHVR